jgi:site-specific recombinase XerD
MTISHHIDDWLTQREVQRGHSPQTVSSYRSDLACLERHLIQDGPHRLTRVLADHGPIHDLADVTYMHLSAYLTHLKREHASSSATLARRIYAFKGFFSWAVKSRLIPADPAADLDVPEVESYVPDDLTAPQVQQLLDQVAGDDWLATRDRALLQFMLNTGLRVSEVVHADLDHLDFVRDLLTVKHPGSSDEQGAKNRRKRTKSKRERVIPLNRAAKIALADWLDRRDQFGQPQTSAVFVTRRSRRRMSTRAVQLLMTKYSQAAGLPGVTPHTLRYTFATRLQNAGADLREVQELLGHASPVTSARYTHKNQERLRQAVQRMDGSALDKL